MDINALLKKFLSNESVAGIASKVGVDIKDVKSVFTSALPMLLGGANAQAKNETTAQSFVNALSEHGKKDTTDIGSFFKNVDLEDGAKIIGHLFGGKSKNLTVNVSKASGVSKANTDSILSMMAPLFMSLLGQETQTQQATSANAGSMMDALFGGFGAQQQQQQTNNSMNLFNAMMGMQQQQMQQNNEMDLFSALMDGGMQQQQPQQNNGMADLFSGLMGGNSNAGGNSGSNGENVTNAFNSGNQNQGMGGNGLDILSQLFGGLQ